MECFINSTNLATPLTIKDVKYTTDPTILRIIPSKFLNIIITGDNTDLTALITFRKALNTVTTFFIFPFGEASKNCLNLSENSKNLWESVFVSF